MKSMVTGALVLSLISASSFAAESRVKTRSGVLVGSTSGTIDTYKGVPFAKPPVGEQRWAPPQSFKWKGVRNATEFAAPCLQTTNADGRPNGGGVSGASSEDCLYLNIW